MLTNSPGGDRPGIHVGRGDAYLTPAILLIGGGGGR